MGAAGSVVDAGMLRKEFEAKAAESVSDEELLSHMKKLVNSLPAGENSVKVTAKFSKMDVEGSSARRGSASLRPNSHNARISYSSSKQTLPTRRGSNAHRGSVDDSRPISAPNKAQEARKIRPRSPQGGRKGNEPRKSRRKSYIGQPVQTVANDEAEGAAAVAPSELCGESCPTIEADSWESVTQQPSCPLCHMAFTSVGKLDQHMKFSPVHAISRGESAPVDNSMEIDTPDEKSSTTIYSGTKLFWRTGLNVELIMQGHEQAKTVQVLAYDCSTDRELGQVWVSMDKVIARIDKETLRREMEAAATTFLRMRLQVTPEEHAAEATRKAAVSFIIKRLQVEDITEDGIEDGAPKVYKVDLQQMESDMSAGGWDLVVEQPGNVNPTFSRAAMRRASVQQVEEAMANFRKSIADVQGSAKAAVAILEGAEGAVEQGRRGSMEVARRASASGVAVGSSPCGT